MENMHVLGRILIGSLFVFSGTYNISRRHILESILQARGVPYPKLFVCMGMSIAFLGGMLVLFNQKIELAVTALIIFVMLASFLYHDFWNKSGEDRKMKVISLMNNMALIGALLLLR